VFWHWWRHPVLRGHAVVRWVLLLWLCKVARPGVLLHDGASSEAIEAILCAHVLLRWLDRHPALNRAVLAARVI